MLFSLSGCGYNSIQAQDERIKSTWSEVLNQYKRRSDLIPNLVEVVKGYAAHEEKVLTNVTEARAKVGRMQAGPELANNPQAIRKFVEAQGTLGSALSRLMVVSERYPDLKANENFRDLQAQIEGTENRIAVARGRYVTAIRDYNTQVRSFPKNLTAKVMGWKVKPNLTFANVDAISQAPKVRFDQSSPVTADSSQ